jgi:hypothetical protein
LKKEAKNFFETGPVPVKPARPSLKKFLRRFFQKAATFLILKKETFDGLERRDAGEIAARQHPNFGNGFV